MGTHMGTEEIDVVVIGAGQAGLAVSHELAGAGVSHVVLERDTVGGSWSGRWDSFCLVTPNHTIRLPGGAYHGDDPDGFLPRDGIVRHMSDYAASFGAPVRTGVAVTSLRPRPDGLLDLHTSDDGAIRARVVIVATGAFQEQTRPAWVADVPRGLAVLDTADYRNPRELPDGDVVIVGSGQCGCQFAEELALAGRRVVLACGHAPWAPRRFGGRDLVDWLLEIGFFDQRLAELPNPAARLWPSPQATGARGGHDLHTRTLQGLGVGLAGHLTGIGEGRAVFADDLADSVAWGDDRWADLRTGITRWSGAHGLPAPELPVPSPFDASTAVREVQVRDIGAIVLTTGFHPAYRSWIEVPDAFDAAGYPLHTDGASAVVPGLYFVGVHFMRKRKSALLVGVGEDAAVVAGAVAERLG